MAILLLLADECRMLAESFCALPVVKKLQRLFCSKIRFIFIVLLNMKLLSSYRVNMQMNLKHLFD